MEIIKEELAWMAGFFDGEGSVSIRIRIGKSGLINFSRRVCVVNTREDILYIFKNYFGGSLKERKHFKRYKNSSNWKSIYSWELHSKSSGDFIEKIYPYLKLKKEHARLYLIFHNLMKEASIRGRSLSGRFQREIKNGIIEERLGLANALKILNQRGNVCPSV